MDIMEENENIGNLSGGNEIPYIVGPGFPPKETQFKKGNPGGPGRPKGVSNISYKLANYGELKSPAQVSEKIKEFFPELTEENLTVDDITWIKVRIAAMQGESWAVEFIADRLDGKAKQAVDMTSGGEKIKQSPVFNVIDVATMKMCEKISSGDGRESQEMQE